jgi:1-deoxy-D-xylulose-5-phosphate synthase
LVTVEENTVAGGAGSAVSELLAEHGVTVHVLHLGLPDVCVEHADHEEQLAVCGLDAAGIEQAVRAEMAALKLVPQAECGAGGVVQIAVPAEGGSDAAGDVRTA